ncbi:MAG: cation:proton antiporter [Paracoccaceae bacterium]|nr:cation:proton antiporter [Paracoccaceae bacterium]
MESFLLQASLYLGAAVLIVPLSVRFGLGSVLGYLAAGILLGPVLGLTGAETRDLQHFAEFGVVMMLFLIGLELEPRTLWDMRHRLLGLGGLQIVLTTTLIAAALIWLGLRWQTSLTLGLLMSLSSTAIVLQTLSEKNLMRTSGGRSTFSVLLMQDIAVVPMLALIPLLAMGRAPSVSIQTYGITDPGKAAPAEGAAEPLLTLVQSLPGWTVTLLTLAIVAAIMLGGHFLTRPVFRFVHASRLPEMSTFISLLMVLGIAFLMMLVGLSPALGTFIAGVVLANSEFRHQLEADIKPFKGILMGLFFMTVGIGIDVAVLARQPFTILGLTLGLITLKALVLFALTFAFTLRGRDRWLFTLGLAQAGEFGFLIISFAVQQTILTGPVAQLALLVISLSMLLTPALFIAHDQLARRLATRAPDQNPDQIDEKGRVIIAGIGRFGQVVNRMARMSGLSTVVLDADMTALAALRRFGVKGFYGDPTRPELLEAAGLAEAQMIVVAVDDPANATRIVAHARKARPDIHIVARAHDRVHVYELYNAGANDIVRETFDASVRAGRYVLENMGFTEYEAAKLSQTYYKVDRSALRDLAELWVPGQPIHLNDAYIARAKQLDRDLETALLDELDETRPKDQAAE